VTAAALLSEARRSGVGLRLAGGWKLKVARSLTPDLLDRLRRHKPELIEVLRGDRCRRCGEPLAWPGPVGVVHADGSAGHHECRVWAAAQRAVESPDALAEVMLRDEPA
jgi:hypothetical protein